MNCPECGGTTTANNTKHADADGIAYTQRTRLCVVCQWSAITVELICPSKMPQSKRNMLVRMFDGNANCMHRA